MTVRKISSFFYARMKRLIYMLMSISALLVLPYHASSQSEVAVDDLPEQVASLQRAVRRIPGIASVEVSKTDISSISVSNFSQLPFGDLPLAALRRTNGASKSEVLISINFTIKRNVEGLKGLEFISWWVRDAARGGSATQIRSLAYPPIDGQFGETLRFTIDYFYEDTEESIENLLKYIGDIADDLNMTLDTFGHVLKQ
jgi:hypothetical protein